MGDGTSVSSRLLRVGFSVALFVGLNLGLGLGGCADGASDPAAAPVVFGVPAVSSAPVASTGQVPTAGPGGLPAQAGGQAPVPVVAGGGAAQPASQPPPVVLEGSPLGAPNEPQPTFLSETGDGWRSLVTGDWVLPMGSEGYTCVRYTLPEAVSFKAIKPVSPPGTHHTVLTYDEVPQTEDGTTPCDAFANGARILASTGVGTEATAPLPDGVVYRLPKGSQLLLNLHLFNATDAELTGRTGVLVQLAQPDERIEAENVLAGPVQLMIPPGRVVQRGGCTFTGDSTLVEIFPHMHQVGRHIRVTVETAGAEQVIHDAAYDFEYQAFYPVGPIAMRAGDRVNVECTYDNDTGRTISWGDSSEAEMCFVGLVRYPALGGNLGVACSD